MNWHTEMLQEIDRLLFLDSAELIVRQFYCVFFPPDDLLLMLSSSGETQCGGQSNGFPANQPCQDFRRDR